MSPCLYSLTACLELMWVVFVIVRSHPGASDRKWEKPIYIYRLFTHQHYIRVMLNTEVLKVQE